MAREIDALTFKPMNGHKAMTWDRSLLAGYTDGMLIIHKGRVVYERYFGCLREDGKHAIMSMTLSITGRQARHRLEGPSAPSRSADSSPRFLASSQHPPRRGGC